MNGLSWIKVLGLCVCYLSVSCSMASQWPQALPNSPLSLNADYLNVTMPDSQPSMGFTGLHLLYKFHNGFQVGSAIYAAVQGNYGGLFILGSQIGYQYKLAKHLGVFANAFVGTGGGHNLTNQFGNGGTAILSAGAMLPFKYFSVGAGYSLLRVDGGHIQSDQWIVRLAIPIRLLLWQPNMPSSTKLMVTQHKMTVMPFMELGVPHDAYHLSGKVLANKSGLCGIELNQLFSRYGFYFLRAAASFYGGYNGYMDMSVGAGVRFPIAQTHLAAIVRMSFGAGGGGGVDLGGGLFYHPEIGLGFNFSKRFNLNVLGGYLGGFSGRYYLKTVLLGLGYRFNVYSNGDQPLFAKSTTVRHVNFSLGNQTYFNAYNEQNPNHAIQLVSFKISGVLTKYLFVDGETYTAPH